MGQGAVKKRKEASKKKKKEAESVVLDDNASVTSVPAVNSQPSIATASSDTAVTVDTDTDKKGKAKRTGNLMPKKGQTRPRQTHSATVPKPALARVSQDHDTFTEDSDPGWSTRPPTRKSSLAVKTLLQSVAANELLGSSDEKVIPDIKNDQITNRDDFVKDAGSAGAESFESPSDDSSDEVEIEAPRLTLPQPRQKSKAARFEKTATSADDDSDNESFHITIEVINRQKGIRAIEVIPSMITWPPLEQQLARILDIYPTSLHAQYRFSTDAKEALPFDLRNKDHLNTMVRLLRPLVVPPKLASGRRSTRAMKAVTVQVFNKGDGAEVNKKTAGASKLKSSITDKEWPKTDMDEFHKKRSMVRKTIVQQFRCDIHSLPDKPACCLKEPTTGICYPITEANLNLWATLHIKDPVKNPINAKPAEVTIFANPPRMRTPANQMGAAPPTPFAPPPGAYPYGYYPSPMPYPPPSAWFPPSVPGYPAPPVPPAPPAPPANPDVEYPMISTWLTHCDRHPQRTGENFSQHAWKFDREGYRRIHQLTRITVEQLSDWLSIGKGTADLIIGYAEEDVAKLKAGTFIMTLADDFGDVANFAGDF